MKPAVFLMKTLTFLAALFVIASASAATVPAKPTNAGADMDVVIKPFFDQHCTSCHGPKKQKGDLRLDTLKVDFDNPKAMAHWEEIMSRINSGDMPPDEEKAPPPKDIARVSEWIEGQLREAEAARQGAGSDLVAFRKLSREEYANTIRDLLGVTFDVTDPMGLPEDPDWLGFQRISSVLTMSPSHVEKQMAAAEAVLNEALSIGAEPKHDKINWDPFFLRGKTYQKEYEERGIADKLRVDLVPNNGALDDHVLEIKTPGEYIIRAKVSGGRPTGGPAPRFRLYASDLSRLLLEKDVEAPEDQPETIEVRVHLPAGKHNIHVVNASAGPNPEARRSRASGTPNHFTDLQSRVPWQIKFTDDDGKPIIPFLLLNGIEWEGPIVESWPTAAHKRIFFGDENTPKDQAYAREIVSRFAERAWRRPVKTEELDRLVKLVDRAQDLGDKFEPAVKMALMAVLCSKNFIYLEEGDAKAPSPTLTDWELASRLSYFLWSSMPDERLFELARANKLHEPAVLHAEVQRMLADAKATEFAKGFPRQWLQLRKVGMFAPDKTLYPEYDEYLETSMIAETVGYFGEVLKRNDSVKEFLDSDWTMLNERLAIHYNIGGVHGEEMRRVQLQPEDHRGGVLTQGAILSLSSDGTRHRPVHRGVWILESMIGKPPPPPPANVPALTTTDPAKPKATVRQKLEAHRADATCASCHRRIDPLGIAFDNFDAIGRWREVETVRDGSGADPVLDPSGELTDGRKFKDGVELKHLLLQDSDKFANAFLEKMATYAFRRAMAFSDRLALKKVAEESKANDYKLDSMIESLVTSEMFVKR